MLTKPSTAGRQREVDDLLSGVRTRLIAGEFRTVEIVFATSERRDENGYLLTEQTGDFTLCALSK
jgi:hypothetical protein